MKKLFSLLAIILLCATAPLAASAEKLDMGKISCRDFMQMDEDALAYLYFWLDGYVSAKSGDTVLDTDSVENDLRAMLDACEDAPRKKLLDFFK